MIRGVFFSVCPPPPRANKYELLRGWGKNYYRPQQKKEKGRKKGKKGKEKKEKGKK